MLNFLLQKPFQTLKNYLLAISNTFFKKFSRFSVPLYKVLVENLKKIGEIVLIASKICLIKDSQKVVFPSLERFLLKEIKQMVLQW